MLATELPKYRCHKEVRAAKIVAVRTEVTADPTFDRTTHWLIFDPPNGPIEVTSAYMDKHKPKPGGYYVLYDDGYDSFSPAKAFEDGYTRIEG